MEMLFFRIGKKLCAVPTRNLKEVVHKPALLQFLPVIPFIKDLTVRHDRAIGVVDLSYFSEKEHFFIQNVLLVFLCEGIEYSIKVSKIIQVRNVAKTRLISPEKSTYFSPQILDSLCIVGNTHIPVISPEKILHHKRIEPLWQDHNNNRPIAHGHKSVANDTRISS